MLASYEHSRRILYSFKYRFSSYFRCFRCSYCFAVVSLQEISKLKITKICITNITKTNVHIPNKEACCGFIALHVWTVENLGNSIIKKMYILTNVLFPCPSFPSPFPFPIPLCSCNFVNALVTICDNFVFARDTESRCAISKCQPSSFLPNIYNTNRDFFSDLGKNRDCELRPRHGLRSGGWSGVRTVRTARRIVQIQGTSSFSVGPCGSVLFFKRFTLGASTFELLTFENPSEDPGEPWGAMGTLREFDVLAFEPVFANWHKVITTRRTTTGTISLAAFAPSLWLVRGGGLS